MVADENKHTSVPYVPTLYKFKLLWQRYSLDGNPVKLYYSRFYKLMNELTMNNLQVTTTQVNVQFLQQLQPEWSRFVTIVKQSEKIDTVSYHRLFDILKQFQLEVNDIRAERIAKSANPLALIAAAQPYSDNYYQAPKPQRSNATSSSTRQNSDPQQAQRDKEMQKNWALLCKVFQEALQLPTNNLSNFFNLPGTRLKIPHQVGSQVVQQTGIQCFNCKGYGHYAKECRKPKRYEQADWLEDTDEEIDEQELEAHYSYLARFRSVMRLLNVNCNLTLDMEENKTILKQLKKANASLTQELEKCKTNLDETNSALGEAISCRDSCLIALQNKQNEFEKYKAFNDRTIDYEILQTKLNETLGLLALKDIEIKEGLKTKAYEISVLDQKHDDLVKKSLLTKSQWRYLKKAQSEKPCLYEIPFDTSDPANRFAPNREETMTLANESRSKLNKDDVKPYDYTRVSLSVGMHKRS
ncbi:retrovirus-related pol polyprotein from transposon TNT 1-94 [Tanacetum coccineum]